MPRYREGGQPPRLAHTAPCPLHPDVIIEFKQYWDYPRKKHMGTAKGYCKSCYHYSEIRETDESMAGAGDWRYVPATGEISKIKKLVTVECTWCEKTTRKQDGKEPVCLDCLHVSKNPKSSVWVRTCQWEHCKTLFTARYEKEVYCRHDCASSSWRAKTRKELKAAGKTQPKLIKDRDTRLRIAYAHGYKCHMCGKLIDLSRKGPHPLSLTIDHLIPRSDDSIDNHDDPANLAPAHYECNSRRTDRGAAQLQLIGAH